MENFKNNYPYTKLSTSHEEIRLIELLPQDRGDGSPIQARLIRCNLNNPAEYDALSYVWGKPDQHTSIQLDTYQFSVTSHLEGALRHLSHRRSPRRIWVDAICINQDDILERNHQVSIMRSIYNGATEVLVWFGDTFKTEDKISIDSALRVIDLLAAGRHLSEIMSSQTLDWTQDTFISALQSLLKNPYWDRTWVLQEVAVARRAILLWAGTSSDLEKFLIAARNIQIHVASSCCSKDWLALPAHLTDAMHVFSIRSRPLHRIREQIRYQKGPSLQLWELLMACRRRSCTDPRDKIYGILGLVNDWQNGSSLTVDYSLDWPELFRKTAFQILKRMQTLHLLAACSGVNYSPMLHSWVPDWSYQAGDLADIELLGIQEAVYNTSGSSYV